MSRRRLDSNGWSRWCGAAALAALLAAAGCSSADEPSSTTSTTPATATETPESVATSSTPGSGESNPDDVDATRNARVDGDLFFSTLDVSRIGILTPGTGGGGRPRLEWTPIPEAAVYEVNIYAPSGEIYWAWSGSSTSVHVGGEPLLGPNSAGPTVIPDMTWYVLALDESGLIVGQSPVVGIAP